MSDLQKNNNQMTPRTFEQKFDFIEQYYKRLAKVTNIEVLVSCVGTMLVMHGALSATTHTGVITATMNIAKSVSWVMTAVMFVFVSYALYRWFMVRRSWGFAQSAFDDRDRAYIQNLYEQIQRTQKRTRGSK